MRNHTFAKTSKVQSQDHGTQSTRSQDRRRKQARALFLENLELRRVLDGTNVNPLAPPEVVINPNNMGVHQTGGVDYTGSVKIGAGITTAEALVEQEVARKFAAASNISQYTNDQLALSRTWAVAVKPGTSISALEKQLGSKLIPSQIINNVFVYVTPLMSGGMSKDLLIANAKNTGSLLTANKSVGGFMPLFPEEGKLSTDALNPNPPTDPLYRQGLQWHLTNTGQFGGPGTSINAVGAWGQVSGRGVTVTVVDSGLFWQHEDLVDRYRSSMSYDFLDDDPDPAPNDVAEAHGTNVAGLIGATGNNGLGGLGVAPEASLAGVKLAGNLNGLEEAQMLEFGGRELQVSNNSWGYNFAAAADISGIVSAAYYRDVTFGRGGLGAIILKSSGNNSLVGHEANTEGHTANRYTLTVGGVGHDGTRASYSEQGSAVDVTSPTQGGNFATAVGMTTTDYVDDDTFNSYSNSFNGTSAATPVAAGVIALILEARPDLSWRDVRAIVEQSAQKVDATNAGWYRNAAGHDISEQYGFGMVDAAAAVSLARNWVPYTAEHAYTSGNILINRAIVSGGTSTSFTVNQNLKVDQAEVFFRITHDTPEDLRVSLISPSGTVVNMTHESRTGLSGNSGYGAMFSTGFSVTSDFFRDESALGTWRIVVTDQLSTPTGFINDLQLNIFGREKSPAPPPNGIGNATIKGIVFVDSNEDGIRQSTEAIVPNAVVYLDADDNGTLSARERQARTTSTGAYTFTSVVPGAVVIRQATPLGFVQTTPDPTVDSAVRYTLAAGEVLQVGTNFGVIANYDYGDAPSTYGTSVARHSIMDGVSLGGSVDAEAVANISVDALGDDINDTADEDGVIFDGVVNGPTPAAGVAGILAQGKTTNSQVTINTGGKSAGLLHAWADFNGDGDFNDSGEKVVNNLRMGAGTTNVPIRVPSTAKPGVTYMRYRYSYTSNLGPTTAATGGEVEDYRIQIVNATPLAKPDTFRVKKFSQEFPLDVLLNDIPSTAGDLTILNTSGFVGGGSASVSPDGKQVLYTPAANYEGPASFLYTVIDPAGKTSQAKVTLTITPLSDVPIAVDDSFQVSFSAGPTVPVTTLQVLPNDTVGTNGAIRVLSIGTRSAGGFASINPGGASISYRQVPGFTGVETFSYTITNASGLPISTAKVTVTVGNASNDDLVEFKLKTFAADGVTEISEVTTGTPFLVRGYVYDKRTITAANKGVFSANMDLLYDSKLAYVVRDVANQLEFDVEWGPDFIDGRIGSVDQESIIDEIGAVRDNNLVGDGELPGDVDQLLFTVRMVATKVGTLVFKTDPYDGPTSEVSLIRSSTHPNPNSGPQVAIDQITHDTLPLIIRAPLNGNPEPTSRGAAVASSVVVSPLREALRQEAAARVATSTAPSSQSGADAALANWTASAPQVEIPTYGTTTSRRAVNSLFANFGR